MEQLCKALEEIIVKLPKSVVWIAGDHDINLPNADLKSNVIHGATYPIPLYSTFIDFIETHGFTQIVDFCLGVTIFLMYFVQIDLLSLIPATHYQE